MPIEPGQKKSNDPNEQARRDGGQPGTKNGILKEDFPVCEPADCETDIKGNNNTFIILGRDRPSNIGSGYGGKGYSEAGCIQLIAGLQSGAKSGPSPSNELASPSFSLDAARIYISQKANIDEYMGLAPAKRDHSKARSAIGVKADCVRIVGRQNVKIVTGRQKIGGGLFSKLGDSLRGKDGLSTGGVNEVPGTISFIAGNYTSEETSSGKNKFNPLEKLRAKKKTLQPLVKGDNLEKCVSELVDIIREVAVGVMRNSVSITTINTSLSAHSHPVTPLPVPMALPITTHAPIAAALEAAGLTGKFDIGGMSVKLQTIKLNYLNEFGSNAIRSRFVFTT